MNSNSRFKRGLELRHAAIDRLPTDLKAALAAACTQRQTTVFRTYTRRAGIRTSAAFDNLLDAIWDRIRHRQRPDADAKEHVDWQARAETLYPGKDAKNDIYKGCAQIAVLGLLCSNDVLWTGNTASVANAAHEAFMSIYNSLTSSIGQKPQFNLREPDALEKTFAHPLIEAEHLRQERDLFDLEQALLQPDAMPDVVDILRRRSETEARDFLPIVHGTQV
jgi:hypothetical protein